MSPPEGTVGEGAAAEPALHCPQCGHDLTGLAYDRCPECGLEGAATRALRDGPRPRYQKYKRVCLGLIAGVCLAEAILDGLALADRPARTLCGMAISVIALVWCHYDAGLRMRHVGRKTALAVVLLLPIGLSVYLLSQRRWRSFFKMLAFAVGLALLRGLLAEVTFFLHNGHWRT